MDPVDLPEAFKKATYKQEMPINWCPSLRLGCNEEVVNGGCERCGTEVEMRVKNQWMLRSPPTLALLDDLELVDFIDRFKVQQRNWIGRSEGAEIDFPVVGTSEKLRVFTTRPDTIFGATYMVISPEHPLIDRFKDRISNFAELMAYREQAKKKSDFERAELAKDKTGVEIKGLKALNPATGEEIRFGSLTMSS